MIRPIVDTVLELYRLYSVPARDSLGHFYEVGAGFGEPLHPQPWAHTQPPQLRLYQSRGFSTGC